MSSYFTYILSHTLSFLSGCIYIDKQMTVKSCLVIGLLSAWFGLLQPAHSEIKPRHNSGNGTLQELI